MRHITIAWLGLAVLLASSAVAGSEMLDFERTGCFSYVGLHGDTVFLGSDGSSGIAQPGQTRNDRFGAEFGGACLVESVTVTQLNTFGLYDRGVNRDDDNSRAQINKVNVYADGFYVGYFTLTPYSTLEEPFGDQTMQFATDLLDRRDGKTGAIRATWLTFAVASVHAPLPGGTANYNIGVTYSFTGQSDPAANNLANLNQGLAGDVTVNGSAFAHNIPKVVDGLLTSNVLVGGNYNDTEAVFWQDPHSRNEEMSLTVSYGAFDGPVIVESVGIALAGDADRLAPKWVIVEGSQGQWAKIDMDGDQIQYNRYVLPANFGPTESLTLYFPTQWSIDRFGLTNVSAGDWWGVTGSNDYVGLLEFQSFGYVYDPVPEPATMTLLVLGGVALPRRRK